MDRRIGAVLVVLAWLTLPDVDALADPEDEADPKRRWHRASVPRLATSDDPASLQGCEAAVEAAPRFDAAAGGPCGRPGAGGSLAPDPP